MSLHWPAGHTPSWLRLRRRMRACVWLSAACRGWNAGPARLKADGLARLALFDAFFARPDVVWLELTRDVVELAVAIRARHGLRTPDALQAACCLQLGPGHVLLTGDAAFRRVAGLNVMVLA